MMLELNSETVAQPAVIDTQPASNPAPAVSKSNLFVSSCFINHVYIGLKTIAAMQPEEPATTVATIASAGLLFALSCDTEKELPPLKRSQLQKSIKQPAVTRVALAGAKRSSVFLSYKSR